MEIESSMRRRIIKFNLFSRPMVVAAALITSLIARPQLETNHNIVLTRACRAMLMCTHTKLAGRVRGVGTKS